MPGDGGQNTSILIYRKFDTSVYRKFDILLYRNFPGDRGQNTFDTVNRYRNCPWDGWQNTSYTICRKSDIPIYRKFRYDISYVGSSIFRHTENFNTISNTNHQTRRRHLALDFVNSVYSLLWNWLVARLVNELIDCFIGWFVLLDFCLVAWSIDWWLDWILDRSWFNWLMDWLISW